MKKDILTLMDLTQQEILDLINLAFQVKKLGRRKLHLLDGKILALLFEKPSTRTRVSFEVAMKDLGGDTLYMGRDQTQLSRGETIEDTARVLSRYVDAIVARVYKHESLKLLAKFSSIPIINGLSDKFHPVQALSDLATIREKLGKLKEIKVAYIGDGNNVCNSLLIACTKVGVDITVACPKEFSPPEDVVKAAQIFSKSSGSVMEIVEDPYEAVKGADIVYTDTFVSMGMEKERERRLKVFLPKYQVNRKLMEATGKFSLFMHCLPAHRGEEVTDEVLDGKWSIVWDQAENRLHTQKALLIKIFGLEESFKRLITESTNQ